MREKKPTVSVIMTSYNHAAYIGGAIESVRRQDYDAWEVLVADDASTDHTLRVLAAYADDTRVKVFPFTINREHHLRDYAAQRARGDYLAFLNSDDAFLPAKLRKQVEVLENHPQVAAVFTHVRCVDENGVALPGHTFERIFAAGNQARAQWLRRFFLSGNCLCISSAMVRRACFNEIGGFNPLLIQIPDLDLWIRLCLRWDIHVLPEPLTAWRVDSGDRNLSAPVPATNSRLVMEYQRAYNPYFCAEGLGLMPAMFPELATLLPEDTPPWRCYLLARLATIQPQRAARLLGFRKLHELLRDDEVRKSLLSRNRRLLRTFFFSEGTAALDRDCRGMVWRVHFPPSRPSQPAGVYTLWTAASNQSVVCFSVPNPGVACRLSLSMEARSVSVSCRRLRLYDQQTGRLIFETQDTAGLKSRRVKNEETGRTTQAGWASGPGDQGGDFYLPEIDFSAFRAKEIDVEVEIEVTDTRKRFRALWREARRRLLRRCGIRR